MPDEDMIALFDLVFIDEDGSVHDDLKIAKRWIKSLPRSAFVEWNHDKGCIVMKKGDVHLWDDSGYVNNRFEVEWLDDRKST